MLNRSEQPMCSPIQYLFSSLIGSITRFLLSNFSSAILSPFQGQSPANSPFYSMSITSVCLRGDKIANGWYPRVPVWTNQGWHMGKKLLVFFRGNEMSLIWHQSHVVPLIGPCGPLWLVLDQSGARAKEEIFLRQEMRCNWFDILFCDWSKIGDSD